MDAGNQSQASNQVSSYFTAALTDSQVVLGSHTDSWRSCFFNEPVQWLDQLRNWTSRHIQYICREVYNHSNSVVPVEIAYRCAYFGCALWWRKLEKQQRTTLWQNWGKVLKVKCDFGYFSQPAFETVVFTDCLHTDVGCKFHMAHTVHLPWCHVSWKKIYSRDDN